MAVTVLSSADAVEAVRTGVVPVPPEVQADNEAQAAKREAEKSRADGKPAEKAVAKPPAGPSAEELAKLDDPDDPDNVEGEDGLSPRQKRIFTKAMQATISKKFRAQKEAETIAQSEYTRGRLAEERAERLERENAALKRAQNPAAPAQESAVDAPPDRKNFSTDEEYQGALIDYRVEQKLKAKEADEAKKREEATQAEVLANAKRRIAEAQAIVPDFNEVVGAVDTPVPPHLAAYMQESEMFAELGYHLAKNPQVLEKLTRMTDGIKPGTAAYSAAVGRSLVALGKIEGTLQPFAPIAKSQNGAEPKPSPNGTEPSKPRVQAPIVRPLNAGTAQVQKPEAEMSYQEVRAEWQRKNGVSLTARRRH